MNFPKNSLIGWMRFINVDGKNQGFVNANICTYKALYFFND